MLFNVKSQIQKIIQVFLVVWLSWFPDAVWKVKMGIFLWKNSKLPLWRRVQFCGKKQWSLGLEPREFLLSLGIGAVWRSYTKVGDNFGEGWAGSAMSVCWELGWDISWALSFLFLSLPWKCFKNTMPWSKACFEEGKTQLLTNICIVWMTGASGSHLRVAGGDLQVWGASVVQIESRWWEWQAGWIWGHVCML